MKKAKNSVLFLLYTVILGATVLLLMIIFPIRLIPIMLFAAAIAKFIPTPGLLLGEEE